MNTKSAAKLAGLLSVSALMMTPATLLFGAAPLLAIRRAFGRAWFWLPILAIATGFFAAGLVAMGVMLLVVAVLAGVYVEVEEHGSSTFNSGAVGVLASIGAAGVGIGAYLLHSKSALLTYAREWANTVVKQVGEMNAGTVITIDDLVRQLPSAVSVGLVLMLWVALLWERPLRQMFRLEPLASDERERFTNFRVPDLGIWVLIAAFAGANIQHGNQLLEVASMNVFTLLTVIYFFQGLSVAAFAFREMKMGPGFRSFWYVLFVVFLQPLMFAVGVSDFWLDFRDRIAKSKPIQTDN